jgi:pyrimidine operon attenuation protein/uracil phosphoribosyltransferase
MQGKGMFLAKRIISEIATLFSIKESKILFETLLDIILHTYDLDDFEFDMPIIKDTVIPFDLNRRNIILVDDVLFTGRTGKAALEVLTDFGSQNLFSLWF